MKESKKSAWWNSLSEAEQQDPKNVKKLWHRSFFRRRREDRETANAIAYANKQLNDFERHLDNIEKLGDKE